MNIRAVLVAVLLFASVAVCAQTPGEASTNPLAPIEWTLGDWHATAKAPNGKTTQIDNHIYWSETHTAIFFLTRFDGQPHYSGMYAYDTERKQIGFWYVDNSGNFTQGSTRAEGKRLVQEFTITKADGTQQKLKSYLDPTADGGGYHWQVLQGDNPKPLIELDYTKK